MVNIAFYLVYLFNQEIKPKNVTKKAREFDKEEIRKKFWENFSSYFEKAAKYIKWNEVKHR